MHYVSESAHYYRAKCMFVFEELKTGKHTHSQALIPLSKQKEPSQDEKSKTPLPL